MNDSTHIRRDRDCGIPASDGNPADRRTVEMFTPVCESIPIPWTLSDGNSRLIMANRLWCRMMRLEGCDMDDRRLWIHTTPDCRQRFTDALTSARETDVARDVELDMVRGDGARISVIMDCAAVDVEGETEPVYSMSWKDVTERRLLEKALSQSEESFQALAQTATDWEYWIGPEGDCVYVSPSSERITGYRPDEFLADPMLTYNIVHPADRELLETCHLKSRQTDGLCTCDYRIVTRDNRVRWIAHSAIAMHGSDGGYMGCRASNRDVTDQKASEERLKELLHEQQVLLREIHHRVKNNMQVIISLLSLQLDRTDDTTVCSVLEECIGRIFSMALIHSLLYRTETMTRINVRDYVEMMIDNVVKMYSAAARVTVVNSVNEVYLSLDTAIPCGLVLNELLTNAMKHAFPGNRRGSVHIGMRETSGGELVMEVRDTGIGLPPGFDLREADSLGIKITRLIVEDQLGGSIEVVQEDGVTVIVRFSETAYR